MVYVTRGLLTALLDLAEEAEPADSNVVLATTPAGEFERDIGLDPTAPVLTHFYLPTVGQSVTAVFGMDLGTPAGKGRARFLTHQNGRLELTREDDLAAVVLVAVPPWETDSVAAFDRSGRRLPLDIVDAEPPQETLA